MFNLFTLKLIVALASSDYKFDCTDYGEGIPLELHNKLFVKFQQLGNTENKKLPGTGLDLNISKHIIDAHHS